ncbi:MAG: hypothetical protein ACAH09_12000 [Methylophilaceae bacterium]|jgi:hypothetical protein
MAPEVIASIIAASTALVAVVIGPFFMIRASKIQMLGPMRQTWINNLRDTVGEFVAHVYIARWHIVAATSAPDETRRTQEIEDRNRVQLAYQLKEKISLLINPKEEDHIELIRLVENAYRDYYNGQDTITAIQAIRSQTQSILKREWAVVKQ